MGDHSTRAENIINEYPEKEPLLNRPEDYHTTEFRPPKLGILEFAVMMYYAVIVTAQPILQQYIYHRVLSEERNHTEGNTTAVYLPQPNGSSGSCDKNSSSREEESAQQQASLWMMVIGAAMTFPGIFSTIIMGTYIDIKGRKLGLILPALGSVLKSISILLVVGLNWPLPIIAVGAFIEGCSGFFGTMSAATFSYIADITQPGKDRTFRFTLMQALISLATALSNLGTGFFIQATGYFFPVLAGLGLVGVNLVIVILFIPESIPQRSDTSIFQCATLKNCVRTYIKPRQGGKRWILITLLLAQVLYELPNVGKIEVSTLFEMLFPFCWDSVRIGFFGFFSTFSSIVGMMLLLPLFQKCVPDIVIAMIGSVSEIAGNIVFGLARTTMMIYLSAGAGILYLFPFAMIKSVMSVAVGSEEQGSLFAGIAVVQAIGSVIGVLLLTPIYRATVAFMPGFVFLVMAGLVAVSISLITVVFVFGGVGRQQQRPAVLE